MTTSKPNDTSTESAPEQQRLSRRSFVVGGVAALGTLVAGTGHAEGQETITTRAITIDREKFGSDIEGFFIHAGGIVDPIDAEAADQCEYGNWAPERTRAYDVHLINALAEDNPSVRTTLYVPSDVAIPSGSLFVVSAVHPCPETGYVGMEINQIGIVELGGDEATESIPEKERN